MTYFLFCFACFALGLHAFTPARATCFALAHVHGFTNFITRFYLKFENLLKY
jgi:hypothetical protein